MAPYDLSEAEWKIVEQLLPPSGLGPRRVDDRQVVNGIFYVLRTGSPWRDLPERYGPHTTCYNRFNRWAKAGVWLRVFAALAQASPQSLHLIDSSIIRAHQHAAGGKKGARITPLAVLVEDRGLPRRIVLTAGQAHDGSAVPELLQGLPPDRDVVADRGYDSNATLEL